MLNFFKFLLLTAILAQPILYGVTIDNRSRKIIFLSEFYDIEQSELVGTDIVLKPDDYWDILDINRFSAFVDDLGFKIYCDDDDAVVFTDHTGFFAVKKNEMYYYPLA